jgi:DMSO/TMAO reductase YedYZ heme-binding membrane subunit
MNKDELYQWLKALGYAAVIFAFFSIYLYLRREVFNLYVLNKVFGSTAAVLGGITLLVGPLFKRFAYFAHFMGIRRELGLTAFGLAIAHVTASLILQNKFSFPSWYLKELTPILFGIGAILIWFYMAYISRSSSIKQLGADVWKKRLSLAGKIAFLSIFLHLVILKYPGWTVWFKGQTKQSPELANPSYPPASLFVFAVMLAIIVFRLINDLIHKQPKEIQKSDADLKESGT